MAKTVVAIFESRADAERAAELLVDEGFDRTDVDIHAGDWTASKSRSGSWWDWLFGESDDSATYLESSRAGAILSVTTVSDAAAERAHAVLAGVAEDVQTEETRRGASTAAGRDTRQTKDTQRAAATGRSGEQVVPVVEERVKIGKRPVARGGVRVYTRVLEQPVEEQIRLREERIRVHRRPVDRPVTAADERAFREGVVEMTETSEEAVVQKERRVVEEIVVDKEVAERTETVRDTVRRTDVRVDEGAAKAQGGDVATIYNRHENDFRTHAAGLPGGRPWEEYRDVYRAGCELAGDARYTGREWSAVESDLRKDWERRRPGTWERFKDSLRYAWDRARGTRRAA